MSGHGALTTRVHGDSNISGNDSGNSTNDRSSGSGGHDDSLAAVADPTATDGRGGSIADGNGARDAPATTGHLKRRMVCTVAGVDADQAVRVLKSRVRSTAWTVAGQALVDGDDSATATPAPGTSADIDVDIDGGMVMEYDEAMDVSATAARDGTVTGDGDSDMAGDGVVAASGHAPTHGDTGHRGGLGDVGHQVGDAAATASAAADVRVPVGSELPEGVNVADGDKCGPQPSVPGAAGAARESGWDGATAVRHPTSAPSVWVSAYPVPLSKTAYKVVDDLAALRGQCPHAQHCVDCCLAKLSYVELRVEGEGGREEGREGGLLE